MTKFKKLPAALARSPILWGSLATAGFYWLLSGGVIYSRFVHRYFAGHPVEYVTTLLFFIGLAGLAIKAVETLGQRRWLADSLLGPMRRGGQPVSDAELLLGRLERLSARQRGEYRVRRLRAALDYVLRNGTAEGLDEKLQYLADEDAVRSHDGYGMVRMILWAMPMLGFLGTVIGIALAMGKLSPQALETSLPEVMAGLTVAFDTTALALALTIALFFTLFLISRSENELLDEVNQRVEAEMVGRFEKMGSGADGQLAAVRKMLEATAESTESIVRRQAEIWRDAIEAGERRWTQKADQSGKQLQSALAASLGESLKAHARELAAVERASADQTRQQWERVRQVVAENTGSLVELQKGMTAQADFLGRVVGAVGEVTKLEKELNRNLAALAGSKNFEQTVMSLAAAIHLLNSRLGQLPTDAPRVQLETDRKKGHAA